MDNLPDFIKVTPSPREMPEQTCDLQSQMKWYSPLLGIWAIDGIFGSGIMYLLRSPSMLLEFFCHNESLVDLGINIPETVINPTGQKIIEKDVLSKKEIKDRREFRSDITGRVFDMLRERRAELFKLNMTGDLPIFKNIELISDHLQLNGAEKAVLTLSSFFYCFFSFNDFFSELRINRNDDDYSKLLARLSGQDRDTIRKAIGRNGILYKTGIITRIDDQKNLDYPQTICNWVGLSEPVGNHIATYPIDIYKITPRLLRKSQPSEISITAFTKQLEDTTLVSSYLRQSTIKPERVMNILVYGPSGRGKTEYVRSLCKAVGLALFEVACSDEVGKPLNGIERARNLVDCQSILEGRSNVAVLFDGFDEVFAAMRIGESIESTVTSVAWPRTWLCQRLEANFVPTFWITADSNLDAAVLQRFDYSISFYGNNSLDSEEMVFDHLGIDEDVDSALRQRVLDESLTPAQIKCAERFARLSSHASFVLQNAIKAIERSQSLLHHERSSLSH